MAYSKLVQAFADAWGSVTGFFAENQFENVDWSTFQNFSKANAALHDRGPNGQRGLHKRFRYCTRAEVVANGNEGQALEDLDFDTCCVGTQIVVQYYQPDPLVPATREQLLVAVYDATFSNYVYSDGSFRASDRIAPAKFVPAASAVAQYGYLRRDTSPGSIDNWRVGELSIWELNGVDEFATAKQVGGPFPAFTGVEDAYWKPAGAPSAPATGGVSQYRYDDYPVLAAGPQSISLPGMTFVYSVTKLGVNGTTSPLGHGNGFTFSAGILEVLAAANVQAQAVLQIVHNGTGIGTPATPGSAPAAPTNPVTNDAGHFFTFNPATSTTGTAPIAPGSPTTSGSTFIFKPSTY